MKLYFDDCYCGEDFEAYCDLPEDWYGGDDMSDLFNNGFIWFKAYDTAEVPYDMTEEFAKDGYAFECIVRFQYDPACGPYHEEDLAIFGARDREEAERLLQVAADALYGEE